MTLCLVTTRDTIHSTTSIITQVGYMYSAVYSKSFDQPDFYSMVDQSGPIFLPIVEIGGAPSSSFFVKF